MPYPGLPPPSVQASYYNTTTKSTLPAFLNDLDHSLSTTFVVLRRFCTKVNAAADSRELLPKELLLETMASVAYRLLDMSYEIGSLNEAVRLGLLAFCSHIFLQWANMKPPLAQFSMLYKQSFISLRPPHDVKSSQVRIWLLMVGAVSVFDGLEDRLWVVPWLRDSVRSCNIVSWRQMQDLLVSFMWVGIVQDDSGKDVFGSAISCWSESLDTSSFLLDDSFTYT